MYISRVESAVGESRGGKQRMQRARGANGAQAHALHPHISPLKERPAWPAASLGDSGPVAGQHRARTGAPGGAQVLSLPRCPPLSSPDYNTVQTVGMTLATILFLLGILIVISKKVKCRKADSSPTCKSCKSELPSSAPGGGGV
ncbi:FXYD domain-containing ion transport regulator 7 isoform X2 [Piliocolobus tephrosceles]|uniref:FXYD domain-containing ion transport regulator 7 isoform X2 n=1 Tax=Piliocolobus tephrosceles TaxID=591936 RepID=UPI000C2AEBA7|nr:FXYD domain-containing ion transport regulator 7 isoform X2 [Piliocolobus tephrosceles]